MTMALSGASFSRVNGRRWPRKARPDEGYAALLPFRITLIRHGCAVPPSPVHTGEEFADT